jgi:hypothetical protein
LRQRAVIWATEESKHGLAEYAIVFQCDEWGILHDGSIANRYSNKQATFESAVSAATAAIRQGDEVHNYVPSAEAGVGNPMANKDHGP